MPHINSSKSKSYC